MVVNSTKQLVDEIKEITRRV